MILMITKSIIASTNTDPIITTLDGSNIIIKKIYISNQGTNDVSIKFVDNYTPIPSMNNQSPSLTTEERLNIKSNQSTDTFLGRLYLKFIGGVSVVSSVDDHNVKISITYECV